MGTRTNRAQQLQYIIECRNSGLTDYQWCKEHGIAPGTFYNWVTRLRKRGCTDIPESAAQSICKPNHQEIVKLDIVPDVFVNNLSKNEEQNACIHKHTNNEAVVEIILSNATIRFVNNTDPALFNQILRYLGGGLC